MNYETMHWKKIKKLVEERGGVYTNVADGLVLLRELPAAEGVKVDLAEAAMSISVKEDDVVFDKSKPYGKVSGSIADAPGARFVQGGHYFNGQGIKVG